jgi:hypothetical protein
MVHILSLNHRAEDSPEKLILMPTATVNFQQRIHLIRYSETSIPTVNESLEPTERRRPWRPGLGIRVSFSFRCPGTPIQFLVLEPEAPNRALKFLF